MSRSVPSWFCGAVCWLAAAIPAASNVAAADSFCRGGYSLSKSNVQVELRKAARPDARPQVTVQTVVVADKSVGTHDVAERQRGFCPTELEQLLADGTIEFARSPDLVLLRIGAPSARVTPEIDLSARRPVTSVDENVITVLQFDPFDLQQTAEANLALTREGICVVLDGYSFDPKSGTAEQYCRDRLASTRVPTAVVDPKSRSDVTAQGSTVLYRKRAPFRINLYSNDDVAGRGRWRLQRVESVRLENASPIERISVESELWAKGKATFVFDRGALTGLCIERLAPSAEVDKVKSQADGQGVAVVAGPC